MLLSFTIKNFRSFREEQTLSMVASTRQPGHPEHLASIPENENKTLSVAAIYGANGAGKSNLVRAVAFLRSLIIRGTEPKKSIVRRPFLLDKSSSSQPTELGIQFISDDHVYAFGCKVGDRVIEAEWLSVLRNGKEISVYERVTNGDGDVNIEAGPVLNEDGWGDHSKARALTEVGVLPNQLFLHAVGKSLRDRDQGPVLAGALQWFTEGLTIVSASARFKKLARLIAQDETFTAFAGEYLKRVATGVDRLRVDTGQIDEGVLGGLASQLQHIIEEMPTGETTSISRSDGSELIVEKGEGTTVRLRTLNTEHVMEDGSRAVLPFSEESDGTQRLTHLLPALHNICQEGGLYIIDEIDRSLHPLLAKGFVRTFLQAATSKRCQLIFTTHDTTFLDLELLRRDEIWFANKNQTTGATELYSLADYKVRTDLRIDRAYLQGRFEAVPPIESELPDWVKQIMDQLKPGTTVKQATE